MKRFKLSEREGKIIEDLSDKLKYYRSIVNKIKDSEIKREMKECLGIYEYDVLRLESLFLMPVQEIRNNVKKICIEHVKEELNKLKPTPDYTDEWWEKLIEKWILEAGEC
jgi:hypothetical protein